MGVGGGGLPWYMRGAMIEETFWTTVRFKGCGWHWFPPPTHPPPYYWFNSISIFYLPLFSSFSCVWGGGGHFVQSLTIFQSSRQHQTSTSTQTYTPTLFYPTLLFFLFTSPVSSQRIPALGNHPQDALCSSLLTTSSYMKGISHARCKKYAEYPHFFH